MNENRYSTERGDCSVRALSRALAIPYGEAHSICKAAGRRDRQGFSLESVFGYKSRIFYGKFVERFKNIHMTVKTFAKLHPKGVYILNVPQHYMTLHDGVPSERSRLGSHVHVVFKISELLIEQRTKSSKFVTAVDKKFEKAIKDITDGYFTKGSRVSFYHSRSGSTLTGKVIGRNVGKGTYTVKTQSGISYPKINTVKQV